MFEKVVELVSLWRSNDFKWLLQMLFVNIKINSFYEQKRIHHIFQQNLHAIYRLYLYIYNKPVIMILKVIIFWILTNNYGINWPSIKSNYKQSIFSFLSFLMYVLYIVYVVLLIFVFFFISINWFTYSVYTYIKFCEEVILGNVENE